MDAKKRKIAQDFLSQLSFSPIHASDDIPATLEPALVPSPVGDGPSSSLASLPALHGPDTTSIRPTTAETIRRQQAAAFLTNISIEYPQLSTTSPLTVGRSEDGQSHRAISMSPMISAVSEDVIGKSPSTSRANLGSLDSSIDVLDVADQLNRSASLKVGKKNILYAKVKMKRDASFDIFNQDSRVFVTTDMGSPIIVWSIIRFSDTRKKQKAVSGYMDKFASLDALKRKKASESYVHLLNPAPTATYNPNDLDDPDLKTGRHRTVITLPSYISSIIQYARPSQLKQELNEQFRQKHPDIDTGLSLSKIRNLKTSMLEIALSMNLELSTVAKAYAYFEKLVLSNYVRKDNRRVIAACCLLLASKINDHKETDYLLLLQAIEKYMWITAKDVRDWEFPVFVALEFNLHIAREDYMPHLERLVSLLDYYSIQEYLTSKPPTINDVILTYY